MVSGVKTFYFTAGPFAIHTYRWDIHSFAYSDFWIEAEFGEIDKVAGFGGLDFCTNRD